MSGGDVLGGALALICLTTLVATAIAPGVIVAALTRERWDDGRHGRRLLIAVVHGSLVGAVLTGLSLVLIVLGSMNDDRGATFEGWPLCCALFGGLSIALTFLPLFLLRKRRAPEVAAPEVAAPEAPAPTTEAPASPARRRRARIALGLALFAYLPAWLPLVIVFAPYRVHERAPTLFRVAYDYGLACGGGLAFVINALALGLAVSAMRAPKGEASLGVLGWGTVVLAVVGALGSPSLIVLSLLFHAFARSVGAVH